MIAAIVMFLGGVTIVGSSLIGPDAPGFRAVLFLGFSLLIGGCVMQPKTKGGGGCYVAWDGRSNPTICD